MKTLTRAVQVAGAVSNTLFSVTIPVLLYSLSGALDSSYLAKDGIALWLTVARNISPEHYCPALDELLQFRLWNLFEHDLVSSDIDDVRDVMLIIEAYALVGGRQCLVNSASVLNHVYERTLGQVSPRAVGFITRSLEAFIAVCPHEAVQFLVQSGCLQSMLRACSAAVPELSQYLQDFAEADVAVVSYLSIFARLCLNSSDTLQREIWTLSQSIRTPEVSSHSEPFVLRRSLLRLLIDKFDSVGYCQGGMWRRRLWCLALLSLFPSEDTAISQWFPEVINICADIISEENSEEGQSRAHGNAMLDCLVAIDEDCFVAIDEDSSQCEPAVEPIVVTFRHLAGVDIVATTSVRTVAAHQLQRLQSCLSEDQFLSVVQIIGLETISLFSN